MTCEALIAAYMYAVSIEVNPQGHVVYVVRGSEVRKLSLYQQGKARFCARGVRYRIDWKK